MKNVPYIKYCFLGFLLILTFPNYALAAYGPYDYTNPEHRKKYLHIVEHYHFNARLENLNENHGLGGTIPGHLWYTIRAFPNHHRALNSMANLWLRYRNKGTTPYGIKKSITPEFCFERAIEFAPKDATVRMLYGIYLYKIHKYKAALKHYRDSIKIDPNSAQSHYNIALLYIKLKQYTLARKHAKIAYSYGYPLPGLKNELVKLGYWKK